MLYMQSNRSAGQDYGQDVGLPANPSASQSAGQSVSQSANKPANGGASDGCTCLRLRSLTRLAGRRYDAHLAQAGLKTTQFSLLSALWRGGAMRAAELAHRLALEPSTLTRNLEPLIQAGWIEATVGGDRRTRVLALTPEGLAQRHRAAAHWTRAQLEIEQLLGRQTVLRLHRLLDHCRDVLEDDGHDADDRDARGRDADGGASGAASPTAAPAARPSRSRRNGTRT